MKKRREQAIRQKNRIKWKTGKRREWSSNGNRQKVLKDRQTDRKTDEFFNCEFV